MQVSTHRITARSSVSISTVAVAHHGHSKQYIAHAAPVYIARAAALVYRSRAPFSFSFKHCYRVRVRALYTCVRLLYACAAPMLTVLLLLGAVLLP